MLYRYKQKPKHLPKHDVSSLLDVLRELTDAFSADVDYDEDQDTYWLVLHDDIIWGRGPSADEAFEDFLDNIDLDVIDVSIPSEVVQCTPSTYMAVLRYGGDVRVDRTNDGIVYAAGLVGDIHDVE